MLDKHQTLQTNLVLKADDALNSIRELSGRLNQISHISFDNVKKGFDSLTKAFEAAQKMSSKVAKVQTENEKELQNLLQKRAKIISGMMREFSNKKSGLSVKVDMSEAQKELQKTTRMVADMYLAMGNTGKARGAMKEALSLLTTLENAGFKNTGIKSLEREMAGLERHIMQMDNRAKRAKEKAEAGLAEEARQKALREGRNPFDDPVYANSKAGKEAKRIADQQARQEAQDHASQQKAIKDYVLQNIEASKAVRKAKDDAHERSIKQSEARMAQAEKESKALQEHLRKMQNQPNSSDSLNKMLGVNENVINTPANKNKRQKQIEKAERLTANSDEANREKALQYEHRVRSALEKISAEEREKALQYEQRVRLAIAGQAIKDAKTEAKEREQALQYEQKVRSAIAKEEYREAERLKRLREKEAENRQRLQDKVDAFQRKVDFQGRPGNTITENQMFRMREELLKLQKMAEGMGATDIRKKLTNGMLDGLNVVTQAVKEQERARRTADQEEEKRLRQQLKVLQDIAKLYKDIQMHKGVDGQSYGLNGYNSTLKRIESLRNRAYDVGLTGDAQLLNPSLMDGANTKLGQFNNRLNEAKDRARQLYMEFRETRSEADRLNFLKAKNDLRELEIEAERFERAIHKASRSTLSLSNIMLRAREHFNWTAGAYVENSLLSIPSNLVSDISKYEMAMAGLAQVLPKAEEGQKAMNQQFNAFSDIASKFGQDTEQVMEAAKSIGRMYGQGDGNVDVGARNTQLLTAQAAKMATVDNFDIIEATRGLESAMAQFGLQTEDTNLLMQRSGHILDVWTKLAHSSGASAQDLTQGVSKAGAAAHQAGVSFEMLNSLIAVGVRNSAESGNVIGNALKSMFTSILSDKNIKSMERYGVEIYRIGKNGARELRPMRDIILDISRLLSDSNMDTKGLRDFMMNISGGKQQYSRVMSILGNYKDLKRTMGLADDANGFTNKQLEIQMDTINRKFQTLKNNVSQLFVNSGADGFTNDLKWILDCLNRVTHALANSSTETYKWAKAITALVVAWKTLPGLINMATRAWARANVAYQAGSIGGAVGSGLFGGLKTNYQAEVARLQKAKLAKAGVDVSELKDVAQVNTAFSQMAKSAQNATKAQSTLGNRVTWLKGKLSSLSTYMPSFINTFVSWTASTARSTGAVRALTGGLGLLSSAFGILRGAIGLLGGPIGFALTLFTLVEAYLSSQAVNADLAKSKYDELKESVEDLSTSYGYEIEQMAEQKQRVLDLATSYNKLVDELESLKQADDNSTESAQRQNEIREEMKQISNELAQVLGENAVQFDTQGKINLETISKLADASHKEANQKIQDTLDKLSIEKQATDSAIANAQARIKGMEAERKHNWLLIASYKALQRVIQAVEFAIGSLESSALIALNSPFLGDIAEAFMGKNVVDGWKDSLKKAIDGRVYNVKQIGEFASQDDPIATRDAYNASQELQGLLEHRQEVEDNIGTVLALREGKSYNRETHQFEERKKINPTDEDVNEGKTHPKSAGEERAEKKALKDAEKAAKKAEREAKKAEREANKKKPYIYDDDESKSFSKASKHINQSYSSMGIDMATMQAIASALNGGDFIGVADPFHNGASNTWDSSYNFAEQLKTRFQSGDSLKTALENIFDGWGIVWDDVIQEEADALRKRFNYKENERMFKDPTEGTTASSVSSSDVEAGLQRGIDTWLGATMDLHGVGCVEAVEKVGSFYSKFLCAEFDKGVRYIPTLMEDAAQAGIQTLQYDASQLEVGDLIVWANDGDTQNHIGVYKGNGMAIDNSSSADQIMERPVDRSWQRNEYIIKTGKGAGGGTPKSRWNDGGDGLSGFETNEITEFLDLLSKATESYKNQQKRLEIEEKLTGNVAEVGRKATNNMEGMLALSEHSKKMWERYVTKFEKDIDKYLTEHPAVAEKVGGKDGFFNLSDTAKQELAKASKDKSFEQAVKNFITAQKNFTESSNKLYEESYKMRVQHGFLSADEQYNYKTHFIDRALNQDNLGWEDRVTLLNKKAEIAQAELARLEQQYFNAVKHNRKEIDRLNGRVHDNEIKRKNIFAEYDQKIANLKIEDAKEQAKALNELNAQKKKELDALDEQLRKDREEISDRANGDANVQRTLANLEKQQDAYKEVQDELTKAKESFRQAGANVSYDFFDKLLLQGKSLKECLKDIVNEIAKITLKRIVFGAFGVKQNPLESEGDIGMLLSGIGKSRKNRKTLPDLMGNIYGAGNFFKGGSLYGGAFGGRGNGMNFPVNFGINQGSILQGLTQPFQQMQQSMTGLTTGLATANSTMGMVNATNQVLNGTNQLTNTINTASRVATTVHTTATHSDASATRMNTTALQANTTALQTSATTAGLGGASGGSGGIGAGISVLGGLLGFLHTGGQIPGYATGGFTNGIIRGAGTGTSDSILTYLAHRGQFIATSNGEYIIQKSAVDKLGVGFLDTLNNNPDAIGAIQGIKRYASGGNLGVSYSPSMSLKGVESYQAFNKANMEKQTHFSTKKMEGLLQGLREDVQQGNKGENTVTQPVILNTQADSASVMKAISQNPRALQAILGKQNKRGFR